MAITFPVDPAAQTPTNTFSPTSTPVANTTNGNTYYWNGTAWTSTQVAQEQYVNVVGDTMTGTLVVPTLDATTVEAGNIILPDDGGITFGTTMGAAGGTSKVLDDYEEGTWTPTYVPETGSFASITYDAFTFGRYTKVGRLCHAWGFIRTDAITLGTAGGDVAIGGFPFAAKVGTGLANVGSITTVNAWAGENPIAIRMNTANATQALFQYRTSITGNDATSSVTDLGLGADDNRVYFTITYEVE
jgi:hypothetical protein